MCNRRRRLLGLIAALGPAAAMEAVVFVTSSLTLAFKKITHGHHFEGNPLNVKLFVFLWKNKRHFILIGNN